MPKVSIIIPIYNVEKYLRRCLDSVINQTMNEIEIICINDGSTDNSLVILEEYAEKDPRIILINQNNQGVSAARNSGINKATSEFILFLDPDDWLDFSTCEQAYNRITTTNADIVFYGRYNVLDKKYINHTSNKYLQQYENHNIPLHIIKHFIHNCWQSIFRLDFLKKNNIYFHPKQKVFEDGTFLLLCLYNQPLYRFLNQNLYYYFINRPESATSGNINVIKNLILANKCLLESNEFQNCKSIEHQILTIEKFILDFDYFYNFKENKQYRTIFCKQITEFKKWLYQNIDNSLLQKTPNIKKLNSYNIIKRTFKSFLQTIFSIKNEPFKKHKIITILGFKIKNKWFAKQRMKHSRR